MCRMNEDELELEEEEDDARGASAITYHFSVLSLLLAN